jgi:hypothetical protein
MGPKRKPEPVGEDITDFLAKNPRKSVAVTPGGLSVEDERRRAREWALENLLSPISVEEKKPTKTKGRPKKVHINKGDESDNTEEDVVIPTSESNELNETQNLPQLTESSQPSNHSLDIQNSIESNASNVQLSVENQRIRAQDWAREHLELPISQVSEPAEPPLSKLHSSVITQSNTSESTTESFASELITATIPQIPVTDVTPEVIAKAPLQPRGFSPKTAVSIVVSLIASVGLFVLYLWSPRVVATLVIAAFCLAVLAKLLGALFSIPKPCANIRPPTPKFKHATAVSTPASASER